MNKAKQAEERSKLTKRSEVLEESDKIKRRKEGENYYYKKGITLFWSLIVSSNDIS